MNTKTKRRHRHGKKLAEPKSKRVAAEVSPRMSLRLAAENEPTVAAIDWLDHNADGFERLALLIEAADHMNERRDIDPDASNHVAVSLTMLREELRALRARLWP
jgi:hypothetical protein